MTLILRKARFAYEFQNGEKINHLFVDDLKLYAKSERGLDSLVQTVLVLSDIGMEFGVKKCAMLVTRRGRLVRSEGIVLPDKNKIRVIGENDSYKYLGVLEADQIKREEMKEKLRMEYKRRVRKILQSKLNGGNTVKAINTWAVSLLRYSAPFVNWTRSELKEMDRMTRKMMTMNRALHPKDSECRLNLPRKEGGRGLIGVEDCVDLAVRSLRKYVSQNEDRLIVAARGNDMVERDNEEEFKKRKREERKTEWREKPLHAESISSEGSWFWLKIGKMKKETEGLLIAAQDQALRTDVIKMRIDKSHGNSKCRMCKEADETVTHIICQCRKFSQLCKKNELHHELKWYEHEPDSVMENDKCKILLDFTIQTDHIIQARRPDIVQGPVV